MPKYNNSFTAPSHIEETVVDKNDKIVGTIRVKPSSVLWKPKGQQRFFCVSLADFAAWITNPTTGADKTSS